MVDVLENAANEAQRFIAWWVFTKIFFKYLDDYLWFDIENTANEA